MGASAFKWYNRALAHLGRAEMNMLTGTFRAILVTSASNFATRTLNLLGSLTNEVSEANGYSSSGKALASQAWTALVSAKQQNFDAADIFWSANGGNIANVKGLVVAKIGASAGDRLLCGFCSLSSGQFTISSGNRLTVQFASGGILSLTAS